MRTERNKVISIAGFDPTGGAGILADVKTFEQLGVDGFAVCTAITMQTEDEFKGVSWIPLHQIELQLDTLLQKYEAEFLKIGLIESFEVLNHIIQSTKRKYPQVKIIWDPVLKSSSGFQFHSRWNEEILYEILSQIFLITPNTEEARALTNEDHPMKAFESLSRFCNVFLKSFLNSSIEHYDILSDHGKEVLFKTQLIEGAAKHGSGCVLSAAITSFLAEGFDLRESCRQAKAYTLEFLKSTDGLLGEHRNIKLFSQYA